MKINEVEVDTNGDWMNCPNCSGGSGEYPILKWMSYCPLCKVKLDFDDEE